MKKINYSSLFIAGFAFVIFIFVYSCKKDTFPSDGINEPITFITPDTNWVKLKRGDVLQYKVRYTTDRRIDSTTCRYNISTKNHVFDATTDTVLPLYSIHYYPDTLNIQTDSASYKVPSDGTVNQTDVIRLIFDMYVKNGIHYQKTLRIDVR
jgi:hypothetical protein